MLRLSRREQLDAEDNIPIDYMICYRHLIFGLATLRVAIRIRADSMSLSLYLGTLMCMEMAREHTMFAA